MDVVDASFSKRFDEQHATHSSSVPMIKQPAEEEQAQSTEKKTKVDPMPWSSSSAEDTEV
ncbi:uncharacterized protein LTR77_008104 [Saxophila tyrrhenica]|uniref:Uncharacterized protein n=1 Tax=Saxophila tyrrhenica TaxID=1690608 RepID=A0AAV9P2A6_9PEZI|nr:hypothetical protein LTR77_008104 [Saxophila tyrrhenica]